MLFKVSLVCFTVVVINADLVCFPATAPAFVPKGSSFSPSARSMDRTPPHSSAILADMEQQRRQELLARKAVQASRKRRSSSTLYNPPSTIVETGMKAGALESSVDDFLSSIGPPSEAQNVPSSSVLRNGSAAGTLRASSPVDMDVDDDIPGLGGGSFPGAPSPNRSTAVFPAFSTPPPSSGRPSVSRSSMDMSDAESTLDEVEEKEVALLTEGHVQEKEDRSNTAVSSAATTSREALSNRSTLATPAAPIPRRGVRRPVAADFVDLDSGQSENPYVTSVRSSVPSRTNSMGYWHSSGRQPNSLVRHKTASAVIGGFASVNSLRRCVIDLSDSDEDEDGEAARLSKTPAVSAAAMELEIKNLRDKIREKEAMIRKKQAVCMHFVSAFDLISMFIFFATQTSNRSTPSASTTSVVAAPADGNSQFALSGSLIKEGEEAVPPGSTQLNASNGERPSERSVDELSGSRSPEKGKWWWVSCLVSRCAWERWRSSVHICDKLFPLLGVFCHVSQGADLITIVLTNHLNLCSRVFPLLFAPVSDLTFFDAFGST